MTGIRAMGQRMVCHEMPIRTMDDLLQAREYLREVAREVGCDMSRQAQLVGGLSDLAERFYLQGRAGRLIFSWDGFTLEAVLEHEPAPVEAGPLAADGCDGRSESPDDLLGGVRFMWDDVAVDGDDRPLRVVLRAWPSG